MKNKLSFIVTVIAALMGICIKSGAQKLKTIIDFDVVNIGDTIKVSYVYEGSIDDIKKFSKVDIMPFVIVEGPYQTSRTGPSNIEGATEKVSITVLTYKVIASQEGTHEIKPVSVETKSGISYISNNIKIRVMGKPGKRNKTSDWAFMQGGVVAPSLDPYDDSRNPYENLNESKLANAHSKMNSSHKSFVLITGWVYRDDEIKESSDRLLNEVNHYLVGLKKVEILDSFKDSRMPRYYYAINDTNNVRKHLDLIFKKAGFGNKATIIFSPPKEWTIRNETIAFNGESDIWFLIYSLMKQEKLDTATPLTKKEKLLMRFSFSKLSKMETLIEFAEKRGYVVVKKNTTKASGNNYYTADFSKQCIMNETEIYNAIETLAGRGWEPGFKCDISALGIDKEKVE